MARLIFHSYFCLPRRDADVREIKQHTAPCQCSVASLRWSAAFARLHPCRSLSFRTHPKMPEGVYFATHAATFVLATRQTPFSFSTLCFAFFAKGGEVRALFASFDFQSARREAEAPNLKLLKGTGDVLQAAFPVWVAFSCDQLQETTDNFGIPASVFLPLLEVWGLYSTPPRSVEQLRRLHLLRASRRTPTRNLRHTLKVSVGSCIHIEWC